MIKTYKELSEIDSMVADLYKENPKLEQSKFGYAYKRFAEKSYYKHLKEFGQRILDIRIDKALEDPETKAVITDSGNPRGFKYTKEGLKAVAKAERELQEKWDNIDFECEPYFCKPENIPDSLTEDQIELLKGCLIEDASAAATPTKSLEATIE